MQKSWNIHHWLHFYASDLCTVKTVLDPFTVKHHGEQPEDHKNVSDKSSLDNTF